MRSSRPSWDTCNNLASTGLALLIYVTFFEGGCGKLGYLDMGEGKGLLPPSLALGPKANLRLHSTH